MPLPVLPARGCNFVEPLCCSGRYACAGVHGIAKVFVAGRPLPPLYAIPACEGVRKKPGNIQRLHAMNARIITYTHTHFAFSAERAGGGAPLCRLPGAHGAPAAHAACQGAAGRYACGGCGWAACVGLKVRVDIGGQLGSVASLDVIPQRCFLVPHCLAASLLLIMSLATIPLLSPSLAARG